MVEKVADSLVGDGKIPWKDENVKKDNFNYYDMALKLLQGLEKRLQKDPSLRSEYKGVVKKYVEKGYITKVKEVEVNDGTRRKNSPHFLVVRTDKETTKVRIATSEVQPSLNDMIDAGPKLQRELFDVLLRFRHYKVALICDISEMYMQIQVAKVDISILRFLLWDENHTDEPDVYEFKILPFGVHVAPFIAQYVAQTTLNCIGKNIQRLSRQLSSLPIWMAACGGGN